jgi:hypothetical protein
MASKTSCERLEGEHCQTVTHTEPGCNPVVLGDRISEHLKRIFCNLHDRFF